MQATRKKEGRTIPQTDRTGRSTRSTGAAASRTHVVRRAKAPRAKASQGAVEVAHRPDAVGIPRSNRDRSGRVWPLCQCVECFRFFVISYCQRDDIKAGRAKTLYCGHSCQVAGKNRTGLTEATKEKIRQARLTVGDANGHWYRKLNGQHEHRVVVEQQLGRKLSSKEIVHHKDHNKRNNHLTNLEVMTQAEHAKLHHKGTARSG